MKFLLPIVLLLSGCALSPRTSQSPEGSYYSLGFNSSSRIELKKDGSYRYSYDIMNCDLTGYGGWETGRWTFQAGVVQLTPDPQFAWIEPPLYSRLYPVVKDGHRQLVCRFKSGNGVQEFGFDEEEPNQSSQRNAMARPISVFESRSSRG